MWRNMQSVTNELKGYDLSISPPITYGTSIKPRCVRPTQIFLISVPTG
jgi:hypothetical protein